MEKVSKNNTERKIVSGYDFVRTLIISEIINEIGEDSYKSELRFDIAEIISNLSRTMSNLNNICKASNEEIETGLNVALSGGRESITKTNLTEEKKQQVKDVILKKLRQIRMK